MEDVIKTLLHTTGLSCDELVNKLQQYKVKNKNPDASAQKEESIIAVPSSENVIKSSSNSDTNNRNLNNDVDSLENNGYTNNSNHASNLESAEQNNCDRNFETSYLWESSNKEKTIENEANQPCELKLTNDDSETQESDSRNNKITIISDITFSNIKEIVNNQEEVPFLDTIDDARPSTSSCIQVDSSQDNLRDIIRMQLSSLRNKKKDTQTLVPDVRKPSMNYHNLKKKRKSLNGTNPSTVDDISQLSVPNLKNNLVSSASANPSTTEDSLVSLSEETKFVIVEVTGGIDRVASKHEDDDAAAAGQSLREEVQDIVNRRKKRLSHVLDALPSSSKDLNHVEESTTDDAPVQKNTEKSPFVSDSLEDFLNECKLKISYPIPKLGAEEGITKTLKESPYDTITRIRHPVIRNVRKQRTKLVKAKTLAEMRKQYEKLKAKEQLRVPLKKNEEIKQDIPKKLHKHKRNSFIMYDTKVVWLNSKTSNKCLGYIRSKCTKKKSTDLPPVDEAWKDSPSKRPSLLSSLNQNRKRKSIYRPGPLSKKSLLQDTESKLEWRTEVKVLPTISLEVTPELRKPISPEILYLLPVFNDVVITEERTRFALTALNCNNVEKENEKFTFQVPYKNNVTNVLVRKAVTLPVVQEKQVKSEDPEAVISKVLNDMITYVETKELEDGLIKEDDMVMEEVTTSIEQSKKGRYRKRKKLELELLRLNCKVINIGSKQIEDKDCKKPWCKLGCVCKTLQCENIFPSHCRLVDCMFECKCPKVAPDLASNNTFSVHTVNHLEDQAKRDLAKEEKEFTQTFIQTDNDTILIGTAKERRSSKPSKKYTDYIADMELFEELPKTEPPVDNYKDLCQKCSIVLDKLNLESVIPFCLIHSKYHYPCNDENVDLQPNWHVPKVTSQQLQILDATCARTRAVFNQYKERNKSKIYNERLKKRHPQFSGGYTIIEDQQEEEIIIDDIVEDEPKKASKRKQSFQVREEVMAVLPPKRYNNTLALQRRKKKPKEAPASTSIHKVFEGEIRVSLKENSEILDLIGREYASLSYLRILPWSKLIEGFKKQDIRIWSKDDVYSPLLCNSKGHLPPKNFHEITTIQHKSDIVNWILNDSLPADKPRHLMHFILTTKKANFLIAGYCLKKITMESNRSILKPIRERSLPEKSPSKDIKIHLKAKPRDPLEIKEMDLKRLSKDVVKSIPESIVEIVKQPVKKNASQTFFPARILKCSHKDIQNRNKSLFLTNRQFENRIFYFKKEDGKGEITLALPSTKQLRWRLIYLNSDFTFLNFIRANYSIKYTDLLDVVKMANNVKATIILRNNEFCSRYRQSMFGIYCVPNYNDRLIIGPFKKLENHNIETLRYIHGKLINTQEYDRKTGRKAVKEPIWLQEEPPSSNLIIDITEDDDVEIVEDIAKQNNVLENCLLCPPFVEEMTAAEVKSKTVNRYIVTNVPYLGYLPALQKDSKTIEVFWPDMQRGFRFANVTLAKNLLTYYFSQIFCPIPSDFKISVIILTNLANSVYKAVDPICLSGEKSYFCGEFGIYEKNWIPSAILKDYDIVSPDLYLKERRQEAEEDDTIIRVFRCFLMTNEELRANMSAVKVLKWANSEIYVLRKLLDNYDSEKKDLENMIKEKIAIINKQRKLQVEDNLKKIESKVETIEIEDSDEEVKNAAPVKETKGKPTPIKISMNNKTFFLVKNANLAPQINNDT